jgi:hypothetical protein
MSFEAIPQQQPSVEKKSFPVPEGALEEGFLIDEIVKYAMKGINAKDRVLQGNSEGQAVTERELRGFVKKVLEQEIPGTEELKKELESIGDRALGMGHISAMDGTVEHLVNAYLTHKRRAPKA